jgi:hypothetical protein
MVRLLSLLALISLLAASSAFATQQSPYDAHQRVVIADGAGDLVFGAKATYRYAGVALAPVATPTDIIVIKGSATKTVVVKRVKLSGVATAQGNMPFLLIRRSTAGTLGSAVLTAVTAAKHDTGDPAPTAVVSTVGTANYTTPGTAAGVEGVGRLSMGAAGSGAVDNGLVWDFSTRRDAPLRLRGASDFLVINANGAAVPSGGVIDYEIEIEEDNS